MGLFEILSIAGLCLLAYLIGSIPFGKIIAEIKGKNIQRLGSGNIGATNIGRTFGFWYALWVGALDACKGAIPVIIAIYFLHLPLWLVGFIFMFCMVGAIFSIWLKITTGSFRAGKGIAVLTGGLLVLAGWQWFIIIGGWLIALRFFLKRKVSAASLLVASSTLLLITVIPTLFYMVPSLIVIVFLAWLSHRENLVRIVKDEEPSVSLNLKLPSKTPLFISKNILKLNDITDDVFGWTIKKLRALIKK
jgi:glycerol-3-phosphate acyltransferase PlsY